MEELFEIFYKRKRKLKHSFKRYLYHEIDWKQRMIAVTGARGVGKTTLILQYIKENYDNDNSVLYASVDNIYFSVNSLYSLADNFSKLGGKYLFLDEIHKYPNWSRELKNIYDDFPEINVVFTGSSILDIYQGFADLSRRVISYNLNGLSFREFIELEKGIVFPSIELEILLNDHSKISSDISEKIKPLKEFKDYLIYGYYPYYHESKELYHQKLTNVLNTVMENDLLYLSNFEFQNLLNLKKLLYILAHSVPFKANITKLSERIGISRNTILKLIYYLEKAQILNTLSTDSTGYGYLTKPEKLYINNTNILFALASDNTNIGNLRETFFLNQMKQKYEVNISKSGDFLVNNKYTFEVGGKNKDLSQIYNIPNSFLAKDDLEIGVYNSIPLWLFGFMY